MSTKDDGGHVHPIVSSTHAGQIIHGSDGMTLRDYFAAKALAGMSYEIENEPRAAQWCYAMADAMLEARKK